MRLQVKLDELGLGPEAIVQDRGKFAVAAVSAAVVRGCQQTIQRMPEPNDPAHAHVTGAKPGSVQKQLSRAAEWVVPPLDWPWPDAG